MFDPSTAHLVLNTLNPFHSTSPFEIFIVPHGPLNSTFPLAAHKYSFTVIHTAHLKVISTYRLLSLHVICIVCFFKYLNICPMSNICILYLQGGPFFKWVIRCNSQQGTPTPVALGRQMKAVILIVVGPGRVIQCLTASLFLLLLETERGVHCTGF